MCSDTVARVLQIIGGVKGVHRQGDFLFFEKESYPCVVCGKEYPIPPFCDKCLEQSIQHKGYRVLGLDGKLVAFVRTREAVDAVLRLIRL